MEGQEEFADADNINMENDYEVRYWTGQLKVTNDDSFYRRSNVHN